MVAKGQQQAFREQVVAYQHCYLVLPQSVNGKKTSSFVGIVYHIIVYQGSGMQQFYQCGCAIGAFLDILAEKPGGEQYEHWPDLFSFPFYDIMHDPVQQRDMTFYRIRKLALEVM